MTNPTKEPKHQPTEISTKLYASLEGVSTIIRMRTLPGNPCAFKNFYTHINILNSKRFF